MKERLYDAVAGRLDAMGFAARRDRLVAGCAGDVLEIGAGTGLNLAHHRDAATLVALEPDARFRRRLARRAVEAHVPVRVVAGAAEDLPFPDASFDHVVCSLVLCSVRDPDRALSEIARVLRPGGRLHLLEHVRGTGRRARWQRRITPLHRRLADGCHLDRDTAGAVARAGFTRAEWEEFDLPRGHPLIREAVQGVLLAPGTDPPGA